MKTKDMVRTQYVHAIDLLPTVLDCLGIEPPETIRGVKQSPIHGVSFAHSFDDAKAPSLRDTQYFVMMGHRSIYHDGWRAVCPWPGPSFTEAGKFFGAPISADELTKLDASGWELYHVAEDFAENYNVADHHRDKLTELISLWYVEAEKYNDCPSTRAERLASWMSGPRLHPRAINMTFFPGTQAGTGQRDSECDQPCRKNDGAQCRDQDASP